MHRDDRALPGHGGFRLPRTGDGRGHRRTGGVPNNDSLEVGYRRCRYLFEPLFLAEYYSLDRMVGTLESNSLVAGDCGWRNSCGEKQSRGHCDYPGPDSPSNRNSHPGTSGETMLLNGCNSMAIHKPTPVGFIRWHLLIWRNGGPREKALLLMFVMTYAFFLSIAIWVFSIVLSGTYVPLTFELFVTVGLALR